jgi:hypothetical protein
MPFIALFVGASALVCLTSALLCYRALFMIEDRLRQVRSLLDDLYAELDTEP